MLHSAEELDLIFSVHQTRKLTKNLTIQFNNTQYQLQGYGKGQRLKGASITLCKGFNGTVTLLHKGRSLVYSRLEKGELAIALVDEKTVRHHVENVVQRQPEKPGWKPSVDHPWKQPIVASTPA